METKVCNYCHICKPWDQFTIDKKRNKPISQCKYCRNLQNKEKKEKLLLEQSKEIKHKEIIDKKICSKCNKLKEITCFYKRSPKLYRTECKQCHCELNRINKKKQQQDPIWQEKTKEKRKLKKEEKKEYDKKRYINLKSCYRYKISVRYWNKLKQDSNRKEKYYFNHANYRKNNSQAILSHRLRERVRRALKKKNISKLNYTIELLGADCKTVLRHIESKFKAGMSWDNKNLWHIDHVVAICHFDLTNIEEQLKAFNYTNLQPLWSEENIEKGKKKNWVSKYKDDDDLLLGISTLFE